MSVPPEPCFVHGFGSDTVFVPPEPCFVHGFGSDTVFVPPEPCFLHRRPGARPSKDLFPGEPSILAGVGPRILAFPGEPLPEFENCLVWRYSAARCDALRRLYYFFEIRLLFRIFVRLENERKII